MPKTIDDLRKFLFAFLIIGAPLSFLPSVATPILDFPSFRLGLYQIIAAIFVAVTILPLYKSLNQMYGRQKIPYIAGVLIALTALISLFFTQDKSRGILLTTSVIFLVLVLFCAWWFVNNQLKTIPKIFIDLLLWSGIAFAGLALIQFTYGTFADTGGFLCKGCKSAIFGFPRINATAAEPLFFANALIPVLITSFYLSLKKYTLAYLSLFATTLAITITLSRGAYLAAAAGILTVIIVVLINKIASFKLILISVGVGLVAGILGIGLMLASATVQFKDTTPDITYNTMQSITEHLSLGVIELPDKEVVVISNAPIDNPSDDFESPGLIESSTNERLNSAELAIDAWADNAKNIIIGTGLGNLGPYVVGNINANAPSNLTVYIFYILALAELGIIGLISFITLIGYSIYKLARQNKPLAVILLGTLVGFATQYWFFGSYINVVYIWLYIGIALGVIINKKLTLQSIIDSDLRSKTTK